MDYSPDPHYLSSKMVENLSWHDALAELIDNSFDANANRCEITVAAKHLIIQDDGDGAPDVSKFVKLGAHQQHRRTGLGMHGRGLKDAWLWLGRRIEIESNHKGHKYSLSLDSEELIANNWQGPAPKDAPSKSTGTKIVFPSIVRQSPRDDTKNKLRKTFMPALRDGRQIILRVGGKSSRLTPYELPPLEDVINETIEVDGRVVIIHAGIVPAELPNHTPGFMYIFKHRVIMESSLGSGDYGASRITGTITLGEGWKLSPHKDNIAEAQESLGHAIENRIRPILEKARKQHIIAESEAFLCEIEDLMNEGLSSLKNKEKRNPPENQTGKIHPKFTGRKRQTAKKVHETNGHVASMNGRKRRGITVTTYDDERDDVLGKADPIVNSVQLNLTHEVVRQVYESRNVLATYAIAWGIFCHDRCNSKRRQIFAFEMQDFRSAWGTALKTARIPESIKP